jgi:hypothetical protein
MPELLFDMVHGPSRTPLGQAVGDITLIAFYYPLRMGEYTKRVPRMNQNERYNSNWKTSSFCHQNEMGQLCRLSRDTPFDLLLRAEGARLKLDNQKNGWKVVCVSTTQR